MGKIFKSKFEDNKIIYAIAFCTSKTLYDVMMKQNLLFRHKCKEKLKKNDATQTEVMALTAYDLCRSNTVFRKLFINEWVDYCMSYKKEVLLDEDIEGVLKDKVKEDNPKYVMEILTLCWIDDSKELNELADKEFKGYSAILDEKTMEELEEENSMDKTYAKKELFDKSLMSMSIGEAFTKISSYEKENEMLKEQLQQKQKEYEKLKDNTSNNKPLKNEISSLKSLINESQNSFKKENEFLKKEISELKKSNSEMLKMISEVNRLMQNFDLSYMTKSILDKQKEANNTLKGAVIEAVKKNVENEVLQSEERIRGNIKALENLIDEKADQESNISQNSGNAGLAIKENDDEKKDGIIDADFATALAKTKLW